ncbi:MAG: hypothetical protein VX619_06985 [bacterium]|nr:hypothetical protein [bacterium]
MNQIEIFLVKWFEEKGIPPEIDQANLSTINIFDSGLISSLEVIFLISDLEENFSFKFNEEAFQDRRFNTISGISEIVSELI